MSGLYYTEGSDPTVLVDHFKSCVGNQGLRDLDSVFGLVVFQEGGNYAGQSQC